ncbi:MAG: hypothetical protein HZB91_00540 [Elusimicrobia bacterium]|nr:hypothetical protein [Elusimicrobiota bacterium]
MKIAGILALAASVLSACGTAHAEKGQWSVSLSPGFAAPVGPVGRFGNQHGNSVHILTGLDYEVEDGYWYGLEIGYSGGHRYQGKLEGEDLDKDGKTDALEFTSDSDTKMLQITPVLKVGGNYTDDLKYAFIVGCGLYSFFRSDGTAILEGTTTNGTSVTGRTLPAGRTSNAYFGLDSGHTLTYGVTSNFDIGLDVRYHIVFMPGGTAGIVVPGLRFSFLFGSGS